MTGKELKAFAARVGEDSEIELQDGYSSSSWRKLDPEKIRAVTLAVVTPDVPVTDEA